MTKCDKCDKNITKTRPGLECHRCEKLVHLTAECSGLNNKQRAALKTNDNLEWTCEDCQKESPKRRSVVIPNEDDDVEHEDYGSPAIQGVPPTIDVKKLLRDISSEMEKAMRRELREITKSLEFHTEKVDEILENMEAFKISVQELKKKNTELTNKNNNLETRVAAMEQRLHEIEQQQLAKTIEISNIPQGKQEEAENIVKKVGEKLQLPTNEIQNIKCLSGRNERPSTYQITFYREELKSIWLTNAKTKNITASDILPDVTGTSNGTIYVREALTPYNKKLLWSTKQLLKDTYKYIWSKNGVIRVKKEDKGESHIIRCENDIKKLQLTQNIHA